MNADQILFKKKERKYFEESYKLSYHWKWIPYLLHFLQETEQDENWILDSGVKTAGWGPVSP